MSANKKSLASSSGNKLNRKLVVTVDGIKDNGSLIENHKNHKVQQQLLSASVVISVATTGLCAAAAVSPKGAAGSTTDVADDDDDASHLKGSNKDEDSGSCSKLTTITSSSGKNKCDIKSGGDGGGEEAVFNSDNLKGNSKRTDREDKGSECEKNKEKIEETQSGMCFFVSFVYILLAIFYRIKLVFG